MSQSFRLSTAEREQLTRDGYVLRKATFSAGECATIAADCEALETEIKAKHVKEGSRFGHYLFERIEDVGSTIKWEPDAPDLVMGIEPIAHLSPPLSKWGLDARLVDPCKDLVGKDELVFFTEKVNYKRARKGGSIILHQDYPYWIPLTDKAHEIATAMVFLDDATVENGCLEVAPGSHREGVQKRWEGDIGRNFEMDTTAFDMARLVPLEVPRGTALFFGPFLVHRSLPNRSKDDRRALLYSYQPAGYPHARDIRIRRAAQQTQAPAR